MHKANLWNSFPNLSLFAFKHRSERSLPPLQFTLQTATGCKEWTCIKLKHLAQGVPEEPQTPTAIQDRTTRALKEKMKSKQVRTELQQAVFLDEKLFLQISSILIFEAMLCNTQERRSLWQTMPT